MFLSIFTLANLAFATSPFLTWEDFEKAPEPKALVFISSDCPCSKAHIEHIKSVADENSSLNVFGVATEPMTKEKSIEYYKSISFPVIQDDQQVLVKKYKALKTPHLTLVDKKQIIYQGGVTNSINPKYASKHYFKDVAQALTAKKPLPFNKGRSLGCYIKRLK
jgi:peroxiredoxin